MNRLRIIGLLMIIGLAGCKSLPLSQAIGQPASRFEVSVTAPDGDDLLWYDSPAQLYTEGMPFGNGRLGGMAFGGVAKEILFLNEDTLWKGYPRNRDDKDGWKSLSEVQRLIFEGENSKAVSLAKDKLLGSPKGIEPYQPLGRLEIKTPFERETSISDYRRYLDLSKALVVTEFLADSIPFKRTIFSSAADDMVAVRFDSQKAGAINFSTKMDRIKETYPIYIRIFNHVTNYDTPVAKKVYALSKPGERADTIILQGQLDSIHHETAEAVGMHYGVELVCRVTGGKVSVDKGVITVEGADSAELYLSAATDYQGRDIKKYNQKVLDTVLTKSYESLLANHISNYQSLYSRVDLSLMGDDDFTSQMPIAKRLERIRNGAKDPQLLALYFKFGRYLLISSSRPDTQPANLQGIWNKDFKPTWDSDYHTNINLQMNYWPSGVTNLSELQLPLFDLMEQVVEPGRQTAKDLYNARGWVLHHVTDPFGMTSPADGSHGIWPMGAAWLSTHCMEQYRFSGDLAFLEKRGYPLMKESARFILDFLVEAPKGSPVAGYLVTNPSHSPENFFKKDDGSISRFTYAATMDVMIIRELFSSLLEAHTLLEQKGFDLDSAFKTELISALDRLPPIRISKKTGGLMEWVEDYDEIDPGHRHLSHLFALYPGKSISEIETPNLYQAAEKSLLRRLESGGGHTGWSRAWVINFFARLKKGNLAEENLYNLIKKSTYDSLLDAHPPFQIDGNFGATAGIAEMLLQSHQKIIEILPALPDEWFQGAVSGLKARGNITVDIYWKDSTCEVSLYSPVSKVVLIKNNRHYKSVTIVGDSSIKAEIGQIFEVNLVAGEKRVIRFK